MNGTANETTVVSTGSPSRDRMRTVTNPTTIPMAIANATA